MAVLRNYAPSVHDVYSYPRPATRTSGAIAPAGYNPSCQSVGQVDWSGTRTLHRNFCNKLSSTLFLDIPMNEESVNFWNQCTYGAVLISPRHVLICQHFRGAHADPTINASGLRFLGRSGTAYTRHAVRVWLNVGPDLTLMELNEEVPASDVYIYDAVADPLYIPRGTELWTKDSNAKIYKTIFDRGYWNASTELVTGYNFGPSKDGLNDGAGINGGLVIFVGDSGSPVLCRDARGRSILVGLQYGGQCINSQTFANIHQILAEAGYSLSHVKLSAKLEDLNQDGKIDGEDLAVLLAKWGSREDILADVSGDGKVDGMDISRVLAAWGEYDLIQSIQIIGNGSGAPAVDDSKKKR